MCSYLKDNNECGKTAQGIKKNAINKDINNVLFNNKQVHHKMKTIRSQKHQSTRKLF